MLRNDLQFAIKLVLSHFVNRPTRFLLTILTTIAAACIVVWVVSSYDSLVGKFDEFSDNYIGRYQLLIVPATPTATPGAISPMDNAQRRLEVDQDLISQLKADPCVASVDLVLQARAQISKTADSNDDPNYDHSQPRSEPRGRRSSGATPDSNGSAVPLNKEAASIGGVGDAEQRAPSGGFRRPPMLVGTPAVEPPYQMLAGTWLDPLDTTAMDAVVSRETAERMNISIADRVRVSVERGEAKEFKIVGIIQERQSLPAPPPIIGLPAMKGPPLTTGPASSALYVRLDVARKLTANTNQYDFAGIVLKPDRKPSDFQQRWTKKLERQAPRATLLSMQDVDEELSQSTGAETVRAQAYSATGISLLAAMFIIFSTLSMGVDERIRQFAMLRAIVCTKAQIAAMIFAESLLLGLIGWAGGLLAGWGLLKFMTLAKPELFPVGATLGFWCIVLSGICAVGGAMIAAVLPAWKAMSVRPLEAMSTAARTSNSWPWKISVVGLALVTVNPLVVFWVPMPDESRYITSAALGCVCMGIGFMLLAPLVIQITERVFAPWVARLLWINPKLLALQLSSNLWRSLGAVVALTLGLGLFVAMQTWGYSMLAPFTPGDWVPDFVVMLPRGGATDSQVESIMNLPEVDSKRSLPCVSEQVLFAKDITGAAVRATSSRQNNCVMVGIDPKRGLGGPKPIFDFRFVSGSHDAALEKLSKGRYCLVPDHFERESGLTVGDKFEVLKFGSAQPAIEYEIAGVVSMSGWHWMSKVGLRNRNGSRSAGLIFTDIDRVREDFGIERTNALWLNSNGEIGEQALKSSIESIVLPASTATNSEVAPRRFGSVPGGFGGGPPGGFGGGVNIRSREGVRLAIRERADGIIWLLSRLPLITLIVTSLGIVNTIVSSVRARQWDLGVLRAVGLTRWGLFRLIVCESLLIGIATCLLSFAFGVLAGYCGTGVTRYVNVRGGQIVPLVIPWVQIGIGCGFTLTLCFFAAIWPAMKTGLKEPLRLLQAGRAATT